MRFPRSCGTLLHPTSLPGKFGIGDFGHEARHFIDFLTSTKQSIWQVLPLTPTGYGNSPYASYSAFAGNSYLISPELLHEKGLLTSEELKQAEIPPGTKANYEQAFANKNKLFHKASNRFYEGLNSTDQEKFSAFKKKQCFWLDDYVLFMACLLHFDKRPWNKWPDDISSRDESAVQAYREKFSDEIHHQYWLQYEFFNQWQLLKDYTNEKGIRVVGDIPIFVDHNSADVWANPDFFEVDDEGNRKLVAGVPPDYFSKTGQLWGNPLYRWDIMEKNGYSWWVDRFRHMFDMYDAIRVDHFRGFEAYWEVPADEKTAENGQWVKGPGASLFKTILEECGELPILAEDLGFVTKEVEELRDQFNFPGMKIIQFAFDSGPENSFLPHNYNQNCVTYSGTHDNDTAIGWYQTAPEHEKDFARRYTRSAAEEIHWEFIYLGIFSVADQAIFPLQDFMGLGPEHRMNIPGTASDNWLWRYTHEMLNNIDQDRIRSAVELSNRVQSKNEHDK